jgi:hypothetical protein
VLTPDLNAEGEITSGISLGKGVISGSSATPASYTFTTTGGTGLYQQAGGGGGGGSYWGGGGGGTWSPKTVYGTGSSPPTTKSFMVTSSGHINMKTVGSSEVTVHDWGLGAPSIIDKTIPGKVVVQAPNGGAYILNEVEFGHLCSCLSTAGILIQDLQHASSYQPKKFWHINQSTGDLIAVVETSANSGHSAIHNNHGYGYTVLSHDPVMNTAMIQTQKKAVFTLTSEEFHQLDQQWKAFLKSDKYHVVSHTGKYQVSQSQMDKLKAMPMSDYDWAKIFDVPPGLVSKKAKKEADEAFEMVKDKENKEKIHQTKKKLTVLFGDLDQYSAVSDSKLPLISPPNGALVIDTKDTKDESVPQDAISKMVKDKLGEMAQDEVLDKLISQSMPSITAKTWLPGDPPPEDQWGVHGDPFDMSIMWTLPSDPLSKTYYPADPLPMAKHVKKKKK